MPSYIHLLLMKLADEAIHSSRPGELSEFSYVIEYRLWAVESSLGYNPTLEGDIDEGECIEGDHIGMWDERVGRALEAAGDNEPEVVALALHRVQRFLWRVDRYGLPMQPLFPP